MCLKSYQRMKFGYYARDFLLANTCEKCGCDTNLELHHERQFVEILNDSLSRLNLDYRENKEDYTEEELNSITYMMLGMQLTSPYSTFCRECHKEYHNGNKTLYIFTKSNRSQCLDREVLRSLGEFLNNSCENKDLFTKDGFINQIDLIIDSDNRLKILFNKLCGGKRKGNQPRGAKSYNKLLMDENINLPYMIGSVIKSKTIDGKRKKITYWKVSKQH